MRSTGCPNRCWSARISGVSNTMSPKAPHRITIGRGLTARGSGKLLRLESARFHELEQSAAAHEMQRADDDHVVLVAGEQAFDLRHPAPVTVRHERGVKARRGVVFVTEQARELVRIAAAPRADELIGGAGHLVHL